MYKVITSLWAKSSSRNKTQLSSDAFIDEDSWVFVSDNGKEKNNLMTNSWIASPPLIKIDELSTNVHHLNPIENLLIEHASMSVYEQIASKTRNRRQKIRVNDDKLDEEVEEEQEEDDDDDDDEKNRPNLTSIHHRTLNSSTTTLESSTSSLVAHHRRLIRLHQRRKRSKLNLPNSTDEPKQVLNKNLERQRLNHPRTPKIPLQQSLKH